VAVEHQLDAIGRLADLDIDAAAAIRPGARLGVMVSVLRIGRCHDALPVRFDA